MLFMIHANLIAESVSYQAFMTCYLNEFDEGDWLNTADWEAAPAHSALVHGDKLIALTLQACHAQVIIEVLYLSATGHHQFGQTWIQYQHGDWQAIAQFDLLLALVREIYYREEQRSGVINQHKQIELLSRLIDSCQQIASYLNQREHDAHLDDRCFIHTEQALLFGHWAHPTPKSRQGMHEWQQALFTPELKGQFQLIWYAVKHDWVNEDSVTDLSASAILDSVLGKNKFTLAADEKLIPVHPLQAAKFDYDAQIQAAVSQGAIRKLGAAGPYWFATSSVRTLYHPDLPWMLKCSIPVKITNSQRLNQPDELHAGLIAENILSLTRFREQNPGFHVIADPAYITATVPGKSPSGFETVIRHNPFMRGHDQGIYNLASLTQAPLTSHMSVLRRLIEGLALSEGRSTQDVSLDWFSLYWQNAVEPLIRLFDLHGIALEAHQQNSLLDVSSGYPRRYFYRDNQGYYLANSYRQHLQSLISDSVGAESLFYDEPLIQDRFGYYLFLNQLAGIIHRFGADGLIAETTLLAVTRQRLRQLQQQLDGAGARMIHRLLNAPGLPCKSNLLTRVHDVDELTAELEQAVYITIRNPFVTPVSDAEESHDAKRTRLAVA
jgi:siderophore synthetase component